MARKKPDNFRPIKNLTEADGQIALAGMLQRRLREIEDRMNEQIDQVKAESAAEAAPIRQELDKIEAALLSFAEYNKGELFAKKRSVELTHGELGFRRSTELRTRPKFRWADVMEKLRELGLTDGIRVREDPNKEALREWPDERLELVGVRRVVKDTFWYEVKQETLETGDVK